MGKGEIIKLKDRNTKVSFKLRINSKTRVVKVIYEDGTTEMFSDVFDYFEALSHFYRNVIDATDDTSEKINACNQFIDVIQSYKLDLRGLMKKENQATFFEEIEIYKDSFEFYKKRINENINVKVSKAQSINISITHKQQILVLKYLDILNKIEEIAGTKEKSYSIIAGLLGKSKDNTKKAINGIEGFSLGKGKDVVNTKENLSYVEGFFDEIGLPEIVNQIKKDKSRLKKG